MVRHGDRRRITSDDGSIYELEVLCLPRLGTVNVLVINEKMQTVAKSILPMAQSLAKSRANRVLFYKTTDRYLETRGEQTFLQAEEASREANEYAETLQLVAEGISVHGPRMVTLSIWLKIMTAFHQTAIFCVDS